MQALIVVTQESLNPKMGFRALVLTSTSLNLTCFVIKKYMTKCTK